MLPLLLAAACAAAFAQPGPGKLPRVDTLTVSLLQEKVKHNPGRVTLVNIWATWCAPCRKEIPALVKLHKQFEKKDFELILVSADDVGLAKKEVPSALASLGVNFVTYIKTDRDDEAFINAMSPDWSGALPASFLYDTTGTLADVMVGLRSFRQFEEAVVKLKRR